jgi:hypothetical protein
MRVLYACGAIIFHILLIALAFAVWLGIHEGASPDLVAFVAAQPVLTQCLIICIAPVWLYMQVAEVFEHRVLRPGFRDVAHTSFVETQTGADGAWFSKALVGFLFWGTLLWTTIHYTVGWQAVEAFAQSLATK